MLNLIHWRSRVARSRLIWLLRWCGLLTLSLGIVTGSIALTLDRLQRDIPNQREALVAMQALNTELYSEIDVLNQQLAAGAADQEALVRAEAAVQQRIDRWNTWLTNRPLRVLSIEERSGVVQFTVQVASAVVLADLLDSEHAQVVSIREAPQGQFIEVRINATEDQ